MSQELVDKWRAQAAAIRELIKSPCQAADTLEICAAELAEALSKEGRRAFDGEGHNTNETPDGVYDAVWRGEELHIENGGEILCIEPMDQCIKGISVGKAYIEGEHIGFVRSG